MATKLAQFCACFLPGSLVDRARIILACLDGKEIQQVARDTGASIPTVSKWRRRFALLAIRRLDAMSDRFGRGPDIKAAGADLTKFVTRSAKQ